MLLPVVSGNAEDTSDSESSATMDIRSLDENMEPGISTVSQDASQTPSFTVQIPQSPFTVQVSQSASTIQWTTGQHPTPDPPTPNPSTSNPPISSPPQPPGNSDATMADPDATPTAAQFGSDVSLQVCKFNTECIQPSIFKSVSNHLPKGKDVEYLLNPSSIKIRRVAKTW